MCISFVEIQGLQNYILKKNFQQAKIKKTHKKQQLLALWRENRGLRIIVMLMILTPGVGTIKGHFIPEKDGKERLTKSLML